MKASADSADSDLTERMAVFRYGLISRLLPQDLSDKQRRGELKRIVDSEHTLPGTTRTRIAESTVRDWMRRYRIGGFSALKPRTRSDQGSPRALAPAVAERLLELKEADPTRTIRECVALVRAEPGIDTSGALSQSTVHRLFVRHGLNKRNIERSDRGVDRRRFAFREAGQLWMSDVLHGPTVIGDGGTRRRRKSYLIAFIDDATRVVPHAEFAFSESTARFLPVMKQALLRRGIPERLYVDNGAAYRSHHLSLVCAQLGIALIHAKSRSPQGKGKIERFFRTVRAQLLERLEPSDTVSLEALNRRLATWIEGEYHHSTSLPESPPAVDPDQAALGRDLLMRGDNFSSLEIEAEVVTRLQGIAEYTTAFEAAFGGGAITIERVAQALAAFQRTLVANNSPFDRWMRGEAGALSNRELSGMAEFARSGCADCHSGPLFSDHQLRVLGVREGQGLTEPDSGGSDFAFRTPSLRQLDFTGPYFHAGQFASLGQAVDFYDERRSSEHPNVPSTALDPEVLEVPGMEDGRGAILADFLRALNDPGFDQSEPEAVPSGLSPGGFSLQ